MSYIKSYNPEVANLVGIQAALLLNHIKFWSETKNVDKVYRTNKQLSEDFEGSLSESQIQRAKKKLVDFGLIIISHDMGHTRTTHYSITEKACKLLNIVKKAVKEVVKKVSKVVKPKTQMEDSFEKQGESRPNVVKGIPDALKHLVGKREELPVEPLIEDEDDGSDLDDYFSAIDAAMEQVSANAHHVEQPKTSFSDIFKRIPNIDILERNRRMKDDAKYFREDY
ncbi:hypothetical protein Aci011_065 [Acinetobacter phage vB_AbaM_B09_Aci01-1]|uniref:Uncharacterized protein n=3 Tax=Saclayvirus TaxID=2733128 RepID=A0A386KMS0_9CAUD|nr:hypothetical protein HOU29_gp116 [Acinetobacter phage vB_AbaM_B09_Aci01-1]YP_009813288.1 hypothetical protein HOU30_gp124 [Acinetobacter phage vB_AbaM_B09_Aci02-2]YP_009813918.1 hypothetical protein HOU35_gp113 [Acinetobacter phage vB_AbaM_B09_Aci05]QMP19098.1 hypothetical protein FKOIJHOC_00150 [Acinetobacter phage Ab_121]AYD82346.1 hypothetical protein Aci05_064 [Acinetobacter phage vB_AbaM_B09_Aci05]AYD85558.1 hypothetical protein Aci011_065 [Acinetobacter phage vB_AbaM_B09_Aci01-1]AYD8